MPSTAEIANAVISANYRHEPRVNDRQAVCTPWWNVAYLWTIITKLILRISFFSASLIIYGVWKPFSVCSIWRVIPWWRKVCINGYFIWGPLSLLNIVIWQEMCKNSTGYIESSFIAIEIAHRIVTRVISYTKPYSRHCAHQFSAFILLASNKFSNNVYAVHIGKSQQNILFDDHHDCLYLLLIFCNALSNLNSSS